LQYSPTAQLIIVICAAKELQKGGRPLYNNYGVENHSIIAATAIRGQVMEIKPSFEEIWIRYYSKVKLYISGHVTNWQDADDLANDVFILAYEHFDRYDPQKASIYTWLFAITRNVLKNFYRNAKNNISIDDEDNWLDIASPLDIENCVIEEERAAILKKAIAELPERQRACIELQYIEGLSGKEIAERIGITPANVRVLVNRAKEKLKRNLPADIF